MTDWPICPSIYEINTWVWLHELRQRYRRDIALGSVPPQEWDTLAGYKFDAIWLMGVWERSPAARGIACEYPQWQGEFRRALPDLLPEDVVGSPYSVRRYVVDGRLGGLEGLAAAREALAARGMRLLLDFVSNHVAPDHPWISEHPEYLIQGHSDDLARAPDDFFATGGRIFAHGRDAYFPPWPDTVQLNPFDAGLRGSAIETLKAIALSCDGVRCDMPMLLVNRIVSQIWGKRAGGVPAQEFWGEVIGALKAVQPDFLWMAEAYWDMEWELQQLGFDYCYDKRLYDGLLYGTADNLRLHLSADLSYQHRLVRFLENHDEPRAAAVLNLPKARAAAVVVATLPGARLFHQGQLQGCRIKVPVHLGRRHAETIDHDLEAFYRTLLAEIAAPVFHAGTWQLCERHGWPDNPSWQHLLAWCWRWGEERRLVVVNLSEQPAQGLLRVPWDDVAGGLWHLRDCFTARVYTRAGDEMRDPGLYVDLAPYGVHVFQCTRASSSGRLRDHSSLACELSYGREAMAVSPNREEIAMAEEHRQPPHRSSAEGDMPPGFKLRYTLRGHTGWINRIAWSTDGRTLASASNDNTVRLWDAQTGDVLHTLAGHTNVVISVTWSPDGHTLASASGDNTIRVWDPERGEALCTLAGHTDWVFDVTWSPDGRTLASASGDKMIRVWDPLRAEVLRTLVGHTEGVFILAWSPNGRILASGAFDHTIRLWDAETGKELCRLEGHRGYVLDMAWALDGRTLASSSSDHTIRLWDTETGRETHVLEGHTAQVRSLSFSPDGRLLASKAADDTFRLWQCGNWETTAIVPEPAAGAWAASLAFHPKAPVLATLGEEDSVIRIWDLDLALLSAVAATPAVHYTNAKVILVGDTGVGKTGLGLVLTGQPFVATDSTHGRHVWIFDSQEVEVGDGRKEKRETLLWDLAGQAGYRLIHQLYLNEVAVALVVFDARSETDPFAGVRYWNRALRQARRIQGQAAPPMKKFLVAARTDRGGIGVSRPRIDALVRDLEFDADFATSAREGWNILPLIEAIRSAISWEPLAHPRVSSTELFEHIRTFLWEEKQAGRLLSTSDDLHRTFLRSGRAPAEADGLRAEFETCIRLVESRGLIRQLSFGHLVLLQPELLDAYASTMVNAARDEPDGMGSLSEEDVRAGRFRLPHDQRLPNKEQEELLLIATVEDLLRHEIALRERADEGPYLVFPSQLTREHPDLRDPEGKAVIFSFEGPVLNIYATLAVRLSHSGVFKKKELWKNVATYTAAVRGTCGMFLRESGEGRGELILFFDRVASEETRFQFEEFIRTHLQRRALPESIQRRPIFVCSNCGESITDSQAERRRALGHTTILCPVCGTEISLLDREERLTPVRPSIVPEMDRAADAQRQRETAASILQGKMATSDFDVFLCHNSADKPAVKAIGEQLKQRGILPWLDEWELQPGLPWQRLLGQQIERIKSAGVFVGHNGIGPWHEREIEAFLEEFVRRDCPVIPVLLPDAPREPQLPIFLRGNTWVDFRTRGAEPLDRLMWGITGKRTAT